MRRLIFIVLALLMAMPASAQGATSIQRFVISAGGTSSGQLVGAIGQPVAEKIANAMLCSGFWCGGLTQVHVGKANLIYTVTFGQLGIALIALVWLAIRAGLGLYHFFRRNT